MGNLYISAAEVTSLPGSGTGYTYAKASADSTGWNTDLGFIDNNDVPAAVNAGIMYRKLGTAGYKTAVTNWVKAAVGSESGAAQPLNPWRHIGGLIAAADLVDMPASTVCNNGQTFLAWVQSLPDKVVPGQTNWNTLRKCTTTSGNNWGAYARGSLLAVGLYLKLNSDSAGQALIDLCVSTHKRWCGDKTVPNPFTASGSHIAGWDGDGGYPGSQGVINSSTATTTLRGANVEDASRGGGPPTIVGAGASYTLEAWDGALMTAILLYHNGYTDVFTWGNSAMRRNIERSVVDYNINGVNHIYNHTAWFVNKAYGTSLATVAESGTPSDTSRINGSGSWLGATASSFLTGGVIPVHIIPIASFTIAQVGTTLQATLNAAATVNAVSLDIAWGDGSGITHIAAGTGSSTHSYAAAGTYTVTLTATSSTADINTVTHSVTVNTIAVDRPPVITAFNAVQSPADQLAVTYTITANDPDGDALTYNVDWGDGTTHATTATGSHTYSTPGAYPASMTMVATVTANAVAVTSAKTVTFLDPAVPLPERVLLVVDDNGNPTPAIYGMGLMPKPTASGQVWTSDLTNPYLGHWV